MFKWVGMISASIAVAFLGVAGLVNGEAVEQCSGDPKVPPLPPQCLMFYDMSTRAILLGSGLTVLLLIAHLSVAAKKHTWRWFTTLLVGPPLSFFCYAFFYVSDIYGAGTVASFVFIPLIGLPNLLFSIAVLKPTRRAATASPPAVGAPS